MELFVAREPVFDRRKNVYAYELFFRAGFHQYFRTLDAVEVLRAEQTSVDLMDFVRLDELTDGKRGFVQFTRDLLTRAIPRLLPSQILIVGLPADLVPDVEILGVCQRLREAGYMMSMEDSFVLRHPASAVARFADVVRVDFSRTGEEDRRTLRGMLHGETVLLARGIAENDQLEQARAQGYACFQGDFFHKPVVTPGKKFKESKLAYFRVLREVNRPELSLDELEACIKLDVAMTYKLLRFMNSAWFGLRYAVDSIKHALVLLGPKEVKKWASLLAIGHTGADKPRELLLRSLTRAKVGEQLAPLVAMPGSASELFLMGMFSVIDALMDRPIAELLEDLPLNEEVKATLLGESSRFRVVYDLILAYEEGQWDLFSSYAGSLDLDESVIPELFRNSSKWANNALEVM